MIFDGHNDVLMLVAADGGVDRFLAGAPAWGIDGPGLWASALAGGLWAAFADVGLGAMTHRDVGGGAWRIDPQPAADGAAARARVDAMLDAAHALAAAAPERLAIVRDAAALARELAGPRHAVVLHVEGAEAVVDDAALEALVARGVRSLGLTWSRPNRFGHGVDFAFPGTPDDGGPGLTAAGRALVARCRALGVLVDLAHLNARGFWDVAELGDGAPLVVSHAGAHAVSPSARNLLDAQLDAIGASGGLVGITFHCGDVRRDGASDPDTPLDAIVDHVVHVAERIGVEHVALGSDLCGAVMPAGLARVERYGALLERLAARGFGAAERRAIASSNWVRVLTAAWTAA